MTSSPLKKPLEAPAASIVPPPRAELTADQEAKYSTLLKAAQSLTSIPNNKKTNKQQKSAEKQEEKNESAAASSSPPTEAERMWLTRDCLLRYLRATNWNVKESQQRLVDTLAWRREYGIDTFTAEYISPEQETGKQVILGYDKDGRPCQYLNPGRQNTSTSPRQIHHLFYMVERVVDMMPPGVEKLNLMINFKPSAQRQNTSVPVSVAREVLHILQSHYPERLGKALIINVPWVVWGFFKLIKPFMHPVTRDKLKFNEDMRAYVPAEQLWSADWKGDLDFDYDHDVYWPALNELCRRRRESRAARWRAAGAVVGEREDYLAAGTDVSVTGYTFKKEAKEGGGEEEQPAVAAAANTGHDDDDGNNRQQQQHGTQNGHGITNGKEGQAAVTTTTTATTNTTNTTSSTAAAAGAA